MISDLKDYEKQFDSDDVVSGFTVSLERQSTFPPTIRSRRLMMNTN